MIRQYSDPNPRAHLGRRNKPIQRAAPRSAIQGYLAATTRSPLFRPYGDVTLDHADALVLGLVQFRRLNVNLYLFQISRERAGRERAA
jgi:hypothetical protein